MKLSKQIVAYVLCAAILNLSSPLVANAQIIGTLQAVEAQSRAADLATVNAALARQEVRAQFESMGVDPSQIEARVASLTDPELRTLAGQMQDLPAGADGFFAVIGLVFLVLLILEAVGVIDIFKKFP